LFDQKLGDKTTFSYLIMVLRDQSKFEEAEDLLQEALENDPENESFLFNLGLVLDDQGKSEQADQYMQHVLVVNPRNSEALNYIAYGIVERGGDLERALKLVTEALQIKPRDGYYLDTLGWIYFNQGRYADAVQVLADAAHLLPNDPVIQEHYGDALTAAGDSERAKAVYQQMMKRTAATKGDTEDDEAQKIRDRVQQKLKKLER
jgi:tetratricopeptide (TPR) repeat protein